MTAGNFPRSLELVLKHEGGFSNHPKDPGHATNMGITRATLASWRQRSVSVDDVKRLTKAEAAQIYRARYWDAVKGDSLPSGLDYAMFDYGVNSGPGRAIKHLQDVLLVRADGIIGPETLGAIQGANTVITVSWLLDKRLAWLKRLKTWPTFGKGWTSRITEVRHWATRMAAGGVQPVPVNPVPANTLLVFLGRLWAFVVGLFGRK
jgi:lysozyme family protein